MPLTSTQVAQQELATVFEVGSLGQASDAELLGLFRSARGKDTSERAFRLLMMRYGSLVLGTCRRILHDSHAAEDAFQATFLILARKAGSIRVEDSLGPWLYGVCTRVARRARSKVLAENSRMLASGQDLPEPEACSVSTRISGEDELRAVIDQEVARLPAHYRSVVVLCRLEGQTTEQVARQLRCPVGTVQSRLHRGLNRLRSRLTRRGVAPAAVAMASTATLARAEVLPALSTATLACVLADRGLSGTIPMAVALLVQETIRRMFVMRVVSIGLSLLALGFVASGVAALPVIQDDKPKATADAPKPKAEMKPSQADEIAKLKAEYEAKLTALRQATEKIEDQVEASKIYRKMSPNEVDFSRRMVELALKDPASKSSRDALIWVINKPFMGDEGPYADEFGRAAALLVRHHGDDPIAISVGLGLHNVPTPRRDALLHGFLASAKSHESKGIARAALARYLEIKALIAKGARNFPARTKFKASPGPGQPEREYEVSDDREAYRLMLAECDSDFIRARAAQFYEELIKDYADVPFRSTHMRELEALLKEPNPLFNGRPLDEAQRDAIKQVLARRTNLSDFARGRLDDMFNLAIGKPAPEIEGVDLEGKPLKLSSYRGKVVLVVFWATWCGPCVREIPQEKVLVEKMKGKPFVLLGVNMDEKPETALDYTKKEQMSWASWFDGNQDRKIGKLYHVEGIPMTYLIDAKGNIRQKHLLGERMMTEVEKLIAETKTPAKP